MLRTFGTLHILCMHWGRLGRCKHVPALVGVVIDGPDPSGEAKYLCVVVTIVREVIVEIRPLF